MTACFGRTFLAWTVALGLALVLVALLVATGESIRHAELASRFAPGAEPDLPVDRPPLDDTYRYPGLAVWPTP